jgi:parallel beta-helix repeat protein
VSAEGLGNTNQLDVAVARDSSSLNTWALRLYQNSGGALQWAGGYSTDGTTSAFTAQSAATGQWYKFDIKYDKTNSRCAWKINGTQIEEFTLTGTLADGVKDLRFGSFAGDATENTYYIDAVKINSSTLGELPANCWRADRSVIPGDSSTGNGPVWFVTSADGKTHHGRKRTSVTECTQAYDCYWSDADNVLVTYSTTDPDSVYSSVEVAEDRDCGVYTDSNSNITFRDLETNYVKFRGFLAGDLGDWDAPAGENILFDGCVSRYTGMIFGTTGGGDGIRTHSANTIIRGCTVHDAGIIGIQLREGANDCIVEHCTAYNNYHFNIAAKVGTADANRPIIRYNLCYTDADYADFTKTTAGVEINLESAESAGRLEDVKIYGNLVYNMNGIGIQLASGADGAEIYNNTIYGVNPSKDAGVWAAGIFVSDELNTNVVVKNNIAVDPGSGGCFVVDDTDLIDAADYNLWYQSAGGSVPYVVADGTQYQSDEQSDYKSATGFDAHSLWESPDFTNAGDNDFTLQSGSPCINAGTDVGLTTDFAGNPIVGNPDIGAYEYQS